MKIVLKGHSWEPRGSLGLIIARYDVIRNDGTVQPGILAFPSDTLEWRAAEYGLDPNDKDALLEMVLYEQFLPDDTANADLHLMTAPTLQQAAAHLLERLGLAKLSTLPMKLAESLNKETPGVREAIKALCVMNPEAIALKRSYTKSQSDAIKQARAVQESTMAMRTSAARDTASEEKRLAELRAILTPNRTKTASTTEGW